MWFLGLCVFLWIVFSGLGCPSAGEILRERKKLKKIQERNKKLFGKV